MEQLAVDEPPFGQVIQELVDGLGIQEGWSFRTEKTFTWWPSSIAQSLWAEPINGYSTAAVRTYVVTRLASGVPVSSEVMAAVSQWNRSNASLSALVITPDGALDLRSHDAMFAEGSETHVAVSR